jgi:antirestriction protein ArdC
MSKHAVRARAGQDRASLHDEITDKIIAELEAARVPWVQPWARLRQRPTYSEKCFDRSYL